MDAVVVILSFNHPELSSRAALSARRLGCEKVILVHNGSLERHVALLKKRFPDITHLVLPVNRGYSGGVNAGLTEAFLLSSWAILLTNDSELVNLPEIPAEPGIVAPKIFRRQTDHIDSVGGVFYPSRGKLRHCKSVEEFHRLSARFTALPYIPGTAFLVHRNVILLAGQLQENLCIYWDDVEWSQRIRKSGFTLQVDERWLARHGLSKTGASDPKYSLYYFQRNRKLISWRFTNPLLRPLLALRLALDWLRLCLRNVWRKRWSALPHLLRAVLHGSTR